MDEDVEALLFTSRPETVKEGRYVIQGRIGAGGVAEVFRAVDTKYDTACAVKLMEIPHGARKPVGVRFLGEAKVMSRLRHPNVPRVYDAGKDGGYYWFVMDLAEGSIAQHVHQHGPYPPYDALRLTFDVLAALSAVHAMGLIHRDVKPENVLLAADGRALLADFGIARHPDGSVPVLTLPGELMGTRGYRAPEQEDDAHEVLPSADLYGVAATLYTMVVGKAPARLWRDEGGVTGLPDHIDQAVVAVIRGGASQDPEERFADARAMAVQVARAADEHRPRGTESIEAAWVARFDELVRVVEPKPGSDAATVGGWRRYLPEWAARLLP